MLRKNPETEDFVLSYIDEKHLDHEIDLSEHKNASSVPLLLQWDKRWGYESYGDGMIAFTGCAPTCLSMVAIYLTADTGIDPLYIANKAQEQGYYVEGVGSDWSIMTAFASELGLDARQLPLDKNTILSCLEAGEPVICAMGPGDFTEKGHFIVLCGTEDGKIRINDPNSIFNSKKLWEFEDISGQIKNLWRYKNEEL
ncbi:MAG: C39 family peptidase [Clostridia bacterium]|nr:C39 family peptidase [Clostridia bacterium]